jgi:hypothetical protein
MKDDDDITKYYPLPDYHQVDGTILNLTNIQVPDNPCDRGPSCTCHYQKAARKKRKSK